jgi:hypothetical protein
MRSIDPEGDGLERSTNTNEIRKLTSLLFSPPPLRGRGGWGVNGINSLVLN